VLLIPNKEWRMTKLGYTCKSVSMALVRGDKLPLKATKALDQADQAEKGRRRHRRTKDAFKVPVALKRIQDQATTARGQVRQMNNATTKYQG
jgi:hypothetical protein